MKYLKVIIGIRFFSLVLSIFLPFLGIASVTDKIVAVVNDEVITLSELDKAFLPVCEKLESELRDDDRKNMMEKIKPKILEQLIDTVLLKQEAERLKIIVKEKDIINTMNDVMDHKKITLEQFEKILAQEGKSINDYKEEIKINILKMRVIAKEIKPKVTVTEEEIGEYYGNNRSEYEGEESVRLQQILFIVPKDRDDEATQAMRETAEQVLKQLKEGTPFDMLVRQYSQGPAANAGGDLGYVKRGMMHADVDAAAFSLTVGDTSEVIQSPIGFHIIKVLAKKGAGIQSFQEVREEIKNKITYRKIEQKFEKWILELRDKSHIEIRL